MAMVRPRVPLPTTSTSTTPLLWLLSSSIVSRPALSLPDITTITTIMSSSEQRKEQSNAAEQDEEEEEEEEEDLEKLQAEIARMEEEAARITKETEELEKKKDSNSASAAAATAGDAATAAAGGDKPARDGCSIYVGQVDYSATPEELLSHFGACGTVERVTIVCDKFTGRPKGFAYLEFENEKSVENAVKLDGSEFKGRQLKVTHKRVNQPGFHFQQPQGAAAEDGGGRGGRGFGGRGFGGGRGRGRGGFRGGGGRGGRGGGGRGGFRGGGGRGGYHPYY